MVGSNRGSLLKRQLLMRSMFMIAAISYQDGSLYAQDEGDELEIRNSAEENAVEDEDQPRSFYEENNESSGSEDEEQNVPWVTPPRKMDPCYDLPEVAKLKAMASILRNQTFVTASVPTDLLLRCNEHSVDVDLSQITREEKVKTTDFTATSSDNTSALSVHAMGGGVRFRYGLELEKSATKQASDLKADGAATVLESGTVDKTSLKLDSAARISNMSVGVSLLTTSSKSKRKFTLAGSDISSTGEQINLMQPGLSLNWKVKNTQLLLGRVQAAEETKKTETVRLPWSNYLRVIRLLEQDQGLRVQVERSGATASDSTVFNKGLIAYFLSVDNATVDIAWFGRSQSYKSSADATGGQLPAFGFAASIIWLFSDNAEMFVSLHSINANDTLGGADKRSAHQTIAGGEIGTQYVF